MENNTFIDPASVRYLVFEGGGGKGFAYLGALQAFKHPDVGILKEHYPGAGYQIDPARIDGVAGASAGAIFAALLGCGIRYETLESVIKDNKLDNALHMDSEEEITKFRIPYPTGPNGFAEIPKDQMIKRETAKRNEYENLSPPFNRIAGIISQAFDFVNSVHSNFESVKALPSYFGLRSAYNLRHFVNELIREALIYYTDAVSKATQTEKPSVPSLGVITFKMHYDIMKLPLSIAGFNAEKGELVYFNYKTAPDMAIADAVRISMSIPVYFLPVYIAKLPDNKQEPHVELPTRSSFSEAEKEKLRGIWIDGGIRANLPAEAFDELVEEDPKQIKAKMLLLRVGGSGYTNYSDAFTFIIEQIFTLISNTSTLYIRKHNLKNRVIKLETGSLSMMGFKVAWSEVSTLRNKNALHILETFNVL